MSVANALISCQTPQYPPLSSNSNKLQHSHLLLPLLISPYLIQSITSLRSPLLSPLSLFFLFSLNMNGVSSNSPLSDDPEDTPDGSFLPPEISAVSPSPSTDSSSTDSSSLSDLTPCHSRSSSPSPTAITHLSQSSLPSDIIHHSRSPSTSPPAITQSSHSSLPPDTSANTTTSPSNPTTATTTSSLACSANSPTLATSTNTNNTSLVTPTNANSIFSLTNKKRPLSSPTESDTKRLHQSTSPELSPQTNDSKKPQNPPKLRAARTRMIRTSCASDTRCPILFTHTNKVTSSATKAKSPLLVTPSRTTLNKSNPTQTPAHTHNQNKNTSTTEHNKSKPTPNHVKSYSQALQTKAKPNNNQGQRKPTTTNPLSTSIHRSSNQSFSSSSSQSSSSTIEKFPVILSFKGSVNFGKLGSWRQASVINSAIGQINIIKQVSNGDWLVGCSSKPQQQKLLSLPSLAEGLSMTTRVPCTALFGVIKGVPHEPDSESMLKKDLTNQGFSVSSVLRLNNKDGRPSSSMRVAFNTPVLPTSVVLGYTRHQVAPYVPMVRRCTYCQSFGHVSTKCRRPKPRCAKCGKNHVSDKCEANTPHCVNCGGSHIAGSSHCVEIQVRRKAFALKNASQISLEEAMAKARSSFQTTPAMDSDSIRTPVTEITIDSANDHVSDSDHATLPSSSKHLPSNQSHNTNFSPITATSEHSNLSSNSPSAEHTKLSSHTQHNKSSSANTHTHSSSSAVINNLDLSMSSPSSTTPSSSLTSVINSITQLLEQLQSSFPLIFSSIITLVDDLLSDNSQLLNRILKFAPLVRNILSVFTNE